MQWKSDLTKDIRFFNISDDFESAYQGNFYPELLPNLFPDLPRDNVTVFQKEGTDFSAADRRALREKLNFLKKQGKLNVILEIGSENNTEGLTSTSEIIRTKPDNCIYLGVDIRDLSQLNNSEKNIHTIQVPSQNWDAVNQKLDELGVDKIDFLFIDGWHSINQVLYDWEYTIRLADHGIVGFHDTAYHPGPHYFIKNLDRKKWNVIENSVSYDSNDYGVGFAWKKTHEYDLDNSATKQPIPVIGVPIVNGLHWLKRLIDSVDYPVNELFIINNNGKGEITAELDKIAKTPHEYINTIKVTHLPYNLGCSGAWNLIIKCYMKSPYWIIVNNDVAFTPGLLEQMNNAALHTDAEMIHGHQSAYDLFLLKDSVVQKCGLFDENLYPIYAEDLDYSIRVKNESIKTLNLNIEYLHGEKDYATSGSQTWRLDSTNLNSMNLKEKMAYGRDLNVEHLFSKWGTAWFYNNEAPYVTPFNNQNYDSKYTTYDLDFVRKKHLGF